MKAERYGALLLIALGGLFVYEGAKLPSGEGGAPGAGFMPFWIGIGLIGFAIPLLIRPVGNQRLLDVVPHGSEGWRVGAALGALAIYPLILKPVGFLLSTFGLFLFLLQFYRRGSWWFAIALSLAAVLGSYWLFARFFEMPLPEGVFFL